jgi:hypothetical protein
MEAGDARARLDAERLSILLASGDALLLSFREILDVSPEDYQITLALTSGGQLILSHLGYQYESLVRSLAQLRNEVLLKDLLAQEVLRRPAVAAEFASFDETGAPGPKGKCEVRLYDTALVVIPECGEMARTPYSDISATREEDLTLLIDTDWGPRFVLSKLGREFDPFKKALVEAMNDLSVRVQSALRELAPGVSAIAIRRAAAFMKEGKAAARSDVESVSPELWQALEQKLKAAGIGQEYDFLKSRAQPDKLSIGYKKGLMGDLSGDYIWFLAPIYSADHNTPGNAIAMEATAGPGGGKATYFFRIVSRADYHGASLDDLHERADDAVRQLNRCMLTVNFRREPIYLSDDELKKPEYAGYAYAIRKLPALQALRRLFIGRVVHSSFAQWQRDVQDLLQFNVAAQDDGARWGK